MRHYEHAFRLSQTSQHPVQMMAAIVVKGGAVLSAAVNAPPHKHAEIRALRPHKDFRGATIYVARANGRVSKPCPNCMKAIKAAGISRICYVDWDGTIRKESV